jgi:hypothetical protein
MTATVTRLRPQRHAVIADSLRTVLNAPLGLSDVVRDGLADALGRFVPPETWGYLMLNPNQQRLLLKAILQLPNPGLTLRVWFAAVSYLRYDTGEIMAGGKRLAEDAGTTPQEVSRALGRLVRTGAFTRLKPGRYAINPHVGWQGSLAKRQAAAVDQVPLSVVSNDPTAASGAGNPADI